MIPKMNFGTQPWKNVINEKVESGYPTDTSDKMLVKRKRETFQVFIQQIPVALCKGQT